jgi:hypothetical protein
VSPVKYELGFYIPEDDILKSFSDSLISRTLITGQSQGYSSFLSGSLRVLLNIRRLNTRVET